jgi:hypothetical protein
MQIVSSGAGAGCASLLLAAAAYAAQLTLPHLPGGVLGGDSSCAPFLYNTDPAGPS